MSQTWNVFYGFRAWYGADCGNLIGGLVCQYCRTGFLDTKVLSS